MVDRPSVEAVPQRSFLAAPLGQDLRPRLRVFREKVPPVLRRAGESAWYGEDDLWVNLPRSPVTSGREGTYPIKYGSFTLRNGDFTSRYGPPDTHARRLSSQETVDASFGGYAYSDDARFWPTGIDFPTPGCWVVTASLEDAQVRFVLQVRDE